MADIDHQNAQAELLNDLLPFISKGSQSFAQSLIWWGRQDRPISKGRAEWTGKLIAEATARRDSATKPREVVEIEDMGGVYSLFDKAKLRLKTPGVVLPCAAEIGVSIEARVASARARQPGTIDIVVNTGKTDKEGRPETIWIGRVLEGGRLELSPRLKDRSIIAPVVEVVRGFAADPITGAKNSARLTGRCCFCDGGMTDERSTEVGYGKRCAENFGLPWGSPPKARKGKAKAATPAIEHDDMLMWPNGEGFTECTAEYGDAAREHQDLTGLDRSADEDRRYHDLEAKLHELREAGHIGERVRFDKADPRHALLGGAKVRPKGDGTWIVEGFENQPITILNPDRVLGSSQRA